MSEPELLVLLRKKDPFACKFLIETHGKRVFNTALGMVQNRHDAEDLAQETFVAAIGSVADFRGEAKISTWLYRIAVTRSLEFLRAKKRKKRFVALQNLFGPDSNRPIFEPPDFQHPGVLMENRERAAILFQAIEQLPENQKTAFILHKTEDLSYSEIAAVLQVSVSSVESLMFRAKQNLRKSLADFYEKNKT